MNIIPRLPSVLSSSFVGSLFFFDTGLPWLVDLLVSKINVQVSRVKTHAKNSTLMATANAAWRTTTKTKRILLAFASVAFKTGYKFRRRKNTVQAKPTPTSAQLSAVNGLQLTSATAIQIRFDYPYRAQHSIKSAVELPNQRSAPHSAMGKIPVYP